MKSHPRWVWNLFLTLLPWKSISSSLADLGTMSQPTRLPACRTPELSTWLIKVFFCFLFNFTSPFIWIADPPRHVEHYEDLKDEAVPTLGHALTLNSLIEAAFNSVLRPADLGETPQAPGLPACRTPELSRSLNISFSLPYFVSLFHKNNKLFHVATVRSTPPSGTIGWNLAWSTPYCHVSWFLFTSLTLPVGRYPMSWLQVPRIKRWLMQAIDKSSCRPCLREQLWHLLLDVLTRWGLDPSGQCL